VISVEGDHDAHVRAFNRYGMALLKYRAIEGLNDHARLCPICILRGAKACPIGGVLAKVIEFEETDP
jgi:hypothetical protein